VVLGDGELQEGQVYEALMTMRTRSITNLTVIVDANAFQSDNLCSVIKLLPDLPLMFSAFGFSPIEIDGNDCCAVCDAWSRCEGTLGVIIAHTTKPAGTRLLPTELNAVGACCQPWHTRVPPWPLYRDVLVEQLSSAPDMSDLLSAHLQAHLSPAALSSLPHELGPKVAPPPPPPPPHTTTPL
jgi:transketolase